jgi:hypothetical protein
MLPDCVPNRLHANLSWLNANRIDQPRIGNVTGSRKEVAASRVASFSGHPPSGKPRNYLGGVSLFDGMPFGPVVVLGGTAGDPLGLPRSGPLPVVAPLPIPVVPLRLAG